MAWRWRSGRFWLLVMCGLATACTGQGNGQTGSEQKMDPVILAVVERDHDALDRALAQGGNPNAKDDRGETALLVASSSDQYRMSLRLLHAGADIWAADDLGLTPAGYAINQIRLLPGTPEELARLQFIEELKAAGYPWPPPKPEQVEAMVAQHQWPPMRQAR